MEYWLEVALLLFVVLICSVQVKEWLQRKDEKENSSLPMYDVVLDFFSYNEGCWHCHYDGGGFVKTGLVYNLTDKDIRPQVIYAKEHPMKEGLWQLEAIHLSVSKGEVVLIDKGKYGWNCMYPNELGVAIPGVVHHTAHLLGKHLRPGRILKVRHLGEDNFEPEDN